MIRFSTYCLVAASALFGFAGYVLPGMAAPRAYTYLLVVCAVVLLVVGLFSWHNEEPLH